MFNNQNVDVRPVFFSAGQVSLQGYRPGGLALILAQALKLLTANDISINLKL